MKVILYRMNDKFHFEAKGNSGVPINIDSKTDVASKGASPMELVLMGIGGCSAIDIVSILQKQRQEIKSYKMEIEGERKEVLQAKPFEAVLVKIFLEGDIDEAKAIRAAKLSFEKYCSVSLTVKGCVEVTYSLTLNGKEVVL